jgi:DNA oxidative demethylase
MAKLRGPLAHHQGFVLHPGRFDRAAQRALLADVLAVLEEAPPFQPAMPRTGQLFSVRMTNCGPLGWVSDRDGGYRYQERHPVTGQPWPAIPPRLLALWADVSGWPDAPQACLVNLYGSAARMGLHVDADETERDAPVVSVSLGDTAVFRLGGPARPDGTRSVRLASGDVAVLGGPSRHCHHGIDRILPHTSTLLPEGLFPEGGRINLTLRRVTP